MKIIDMSRYPMINGKMNAVDRMKGSMEFGPSWYADMQAQQKVIDLLEQTMDARHVLLRNVTLPEAGIPIPLLLIGPAGVWVLYTSSLNGVYRAKEDSWYRMDSGKFKAVKPNLIQRLKLMAHAVETYFQREEIKTPEIRPVLIFLHPGMHVDLVRPGVRVVLADAVDKFVVSMSGETGILDSPEIARMVKAFTAVDLGQADAAPGAKEKEKDDVFSFREEQRPTPRKIITEKPASPSGPSAVDSLFDKANINNRQWAVLGIVFGLLALLLVVFVVGVLFF